MPEVPSNKVGLVFCSGEELAEGTIARQAGLKVLHDLRPDSTVTICLPLFLAGGEGDRAFAKFYPTVAIDGCEKRCAAVATEKYSGKPAAAFVVPEVITGADLGPAEGRRHLNQAGIVAVGLVAERVAAEVDRLLTVRWNRRMGTAAEAKASNPSPHQTATCACGQRLSTQEVVVEGETVTLAALPLLMDQFHLAGRQPGPDTARDLLREVAIYNLLPDHPEDAYLQALERAYAVFLEGRG